ncbi:MAG: AMP-binding protein [Gracilibacteraceae bacterium]|jgi:acyl-coenzyme A synthetase/AMP-(fatty) acid ligase|nr:AMP-binding protein [Gracilibacteraceae bacterium]
MWDFERFADHTALIGEDGEETTYGRLGAAGAELAAAVGGRRLIFVFCANEKGALLGYTAFLRHGAVPVMLDAGLDRDYTAALLARYRPDFLWVPVDRAAAFAGEPTYSAWGYALVRTGESGAFPLHRELALLLTTSGSTGSPKFVRQSYKNIRANTESIVRYLELDMAERAITTLPLHYTYGLSIINTHLSVGAAVILTGKTLAQKEFWRQCREYGATSLAGVPYTYEMLEKLRFERMDLPTLRTLTQAGGKLPPELHRKFAAAARAAHRRFFVMYGQTEATARMSWLPPERSLEKCGSIGGPVAGGEFFLLDGDGGAITEPGAVGELMYRGDNVALGYAESGADLAGGDDFGGVLATGDMAKFDRDGCYYIVGRKKRFLKIFGNRVSLDEAEQLVQAAFGTDCACTGQDDHMLVYVLAGADGPAVRKFLAEKTGLPPAAFAVQTIGAIPKNEAGKTMYAALATGGAAEARC